MPYIEGMKYKKVENKLQNLMPKEKQNILSDSDKANMTLQKFKENIESGDHIENEYGKICSEFFYGESKE